MRPVRETEGGGEREGTAAAGQENRADNGGERAV